MQNYNPNTTDPQEEQLIEVDENDKIIGPVARKVCHNETRKPWHRSTHAYLFNEKGELYFTQRSLSKDTAPGEWTISAGGHVNWGESYEECVKNELKEELDLEANLDLIDTFTIDYGSEREIIALFAGVTEKKPTINTEETERIKTFELEDIIGKFQAGEFKLSGGSTHTFTRLIETGILKKFWEEKFIMN